MQASIWPAATPLRIKIPLRFVHQRIIRKYKQYLTPNDHREGATHRGRLALCPLHQTVAPPPQYDYVVILIVHFKLIVKINKKKKCLHNNKLCN